MINREAKISLQGKTKTYVKVTKKTARELYNCGEDVIMIPSRVDPESSTGRSLALVANKAFLPIGTDISFDSQVYEYKDYNCRGASGQYVNFYVEKKNRSIEYLKVPKSIDLNHMAIAVSDACRLSDNVTADEYEFMDDLIYAVIDHIKKTKQRSLPIGMITLDDKI